MKDFNLCCESFPHLHIKSQGNSWGGSDGLWGGRDNINVDIN